MNRLHHDTDLTAIETNRELVEGNIINQDVTSVGLMKAQQEANEGRLSRSSWPGNGRVLTSINLKG